MVGLGNLSYRYKWPLSLMTAILLTGFVVTSALIWRAYEDLRQDLFRNAVEVGGVLTNTLPDALKNDDLWQAYQMVRAAGKTWIDAEQRLLMVLDNDYRVYVSNDSTALPTLSDLRTKGPELARVERAVAEGGTLEPRPFEHPENSRIYVLFPMVSDGVALGTLVIGYSRSLFLPRFYDIAERVAYSSLAALAIVLPVGWYLGKRMVGPLTQLSRCLSQLGKQPLDDIECALVEGEDEIGQLGARFNEMVRELQEKQRLEAEMVKSERLAAVGRLAAGVAHEINNPLGGMFNAINTFRHHGSGDPVAERTLSLLERGLAQIRETVSALLVEARSESHALTPQDVDDVHMLLEPDAHKHAVTLNWHSELGGTVGLPSTPVRQVLINLSLNAVHAAPQGGVVECSVRNLGEWLEIAVENEGEGIPVEEVDRLFEPFVHYDKEGNGLGLWVTYQIVQQLNGSIQVDSDDGRTRFHVVLPLEKAAA
ncbi:MAG: ATP-binding protein [Gammaproteobacteria bacterium]